MKKMIVLLLVFMLVFSTLAIASAKKNTTSEPEVVTSNFYPMDDTHLVKRKPDRNVGYKYELQVRNTYGYRGSSNWAWDALIKFDLSSIPSNSVVISAKLNLYYYRWWDNNPKNRDLTIYKVTSDWDEETVTWNSQPTCRADPTDFATVPDQKNVWMTWDLTSDVQSIVNGDSNFGWEIKDETYWGKFNIPIIAFKSKEAAESELIPYLEITYEEPNPVNFAISIKDSIENMNLKNGLGNSLTAKMNNAIKGIEKGNYNSALNILDAFIREVESQRDKHLTSIQADLLLANAQILINSLG